MKLGTELPKGGETFGAWLGVDDGDVHCYSQKQWTVIGTNKNYKDKIEFSDMALAFTADGKLTFQYAAKDGTAKQCELSEAVVAAAITQMLQVLKVEAILSA